MCKNSRLLTNLLVLILLLHPFSAHPKNKVYAIIDLPPYGCEPSDEVKCINTEITQVIANIINDGPSTIHAFPYPRALQMFETGKSTILVALINKRLMERAHVIELYSGVFYLVVMETNLTTHSPTISYLRGADAQKEIASSINATPIEVNDYHQMIMMLKANRLDYVIIPRIFYESEVSVFKNAHVLSVHNLSVMLYVNKQESQNFEKIREAVSQLSIHTSEQYRYLFP